VTTDNEQLIIRGLRVAPVGAPDHEILQGIDLTIGKGEVHAIMGPNGSGKTTLAYALMGHPAYVVKGGEVHWKGRDILKLSPDKRARLKLLSDLRYGTPLCEVRAQVQRVLGQRDDDGGLDADDLTETGPPPPERASRTELRPPAPTDGPDLESLTEMSPAGSGAARPVGGIGRHRAPTVSVDVAADGAATAPAGCGAGPAAGPAADHVQPR